MTRDSVDSAPMIRKNLFLPRALIQRTEALAARNGASFAEVVRRALAAYEAPFENGTHDDTQALLERLARVNRDTIEQIARFSTKLDTRHAQAEPQHDNKR